MVETATVTPNRNDKGFSHALYFGKRRYEVYRLPKDDPLCYAYRMVGARGAEYFLLRNKPNPRLLFAVDRRGRVASVFRNEWFYDAKPNGQPCSLRLQD